MDGSLGNNFEASLEVSSELSENSDLPAETCNQEDGDENRPKKKRKRGKRSTNRRKAAMVKRYRELRKVKRKEKRKLTALEAIKQYQTESPNQFDSLQQLNPEPQGCLPLLQPPEPVGNTSSENMYRERGSWRHYHHNFNREGDGRPSRRKRSHLDDIYLPNYEDNDDLIEIDVVESRYSERYRDRNKFTRWSNYSPHRKDSERKRCFKVISPETARGRGRPLANKENATSKKAGEGDNKDKGDNSKTQSNKTNAAQCNTVVNNNSIKDAKCPGNGECDNNKDIRDKVRDVSVEVKQVNKKIEDTNKEKDIKTNVERLNDVSGNIPKTETLKLNKVETYNKYSENENQVETNSNTASEYKEVNESKCIESNSDKNDKLEHSASTDANPGNTVSKCHDMKQNDKFNCENLDLMDVDSISPDAVGSNSENILETPTLTSTSVPKSPTGVNSPNKISDISIHPSKCLISTTPDQELPPEEKKDEIELCHPLPSKFPMWEELPEGSWSRIPSTPAAEIDSDQETVLFDDFISIDKIDTTKSYLDNLDPVMDDFRVVDMVIGTPCGSPVKRKNDVDNDSEEVLSKKKRYDHLYSEINSDLLLTQINEVLKEDKQKNETKQSKDIKLYRSKSFTMENRCGKKHVLKKSKSIDCVSPEFYQITYDFDLKTNLLLLLGNQSLPKMEIDYTDGFANILNVLRETRAEAAKITTSKVTSGQSSMVLGKNPSKDSCDSNLSVSKKTNVDEAKIEVETTSSEIAVISDQSAFKGALNNIVIVLKGTQTDEAKIAAVKTTCNQISIISNEGASKNGCDNIVNVLKETKTDDAKITIVETTSSQSPIILDQGTSNNDFDTVINVIEETKTDEAKIPPLETTFTESRIVLDQNTSMRLDEGLPTCDNKIGGPPDCRKKCDKDNACHKKQSSSLKTKNTAKKETAPHDDHAIRKSNISIVEQSRSIKPQNVSNGTNIQKKSADKAGSNSDCREKQGTVEEKMRPAESIPSNKCEMTLGDYKKTVDISKKSRPPKINLHIDLDNKLKTKRKAYSDTSELLLKKMHELFGNDNDFSLIESGNVNKIRSDESESNKSESQPKKAFEPNRKSLDKNRRNSSIEVNTKHKHEDSGPNKDRNTDNKNRRNSAHEPSSNRESSYSSKSLEVRNRYDAHSSNKNNCNLSEKPKDSEYNKNTHLDNKKRRNSVPVSSAAENCASKSAHQNSKKSYEKNPASRNVPNKLKDSNLNKCSSNNTNLNRIKRIDKNRKPSVPASFATDSQKATVPKDKPLKISPCQKGDRLQRNENTITECKRKFDESKDKCNRTTNVDASKNQQNNNVGERERKEIESKTSRKTSNENKRRLSLDSEKSTQQRSINEQKEKQTKFIENSKISTKDTIQEATEKQLLPKHSKGNNTPSGTCEDNTLPVKNSVNETLNMVQEENTILKEKAQQNLKTPSPIKNNKIDSEDLFQNVNLLQPQLILHKVDGESPTDICTNALVAERRNSVLKNTLIPIINSVSAVNCERCAVLHQERFPMRQKGRYSIAENDCCDVAVTLDPPDIRNDINNVKQIIPAPPSIDAKESQKESDDVIEIIPNIPVIDLTDDGIEVKMEEVTSTSKVDLTIVKDKKEDLTIGLGDAGNANDERITLYRSDETLNNSLEVQALVASISSKVLSKNSVSSKQSDDTTNELLNKNVTVETTQTSSESTTDDKMVSQLEVNDSPAVSSRSEITSSVLQTAVSGSGCETSENTITRLEVTSATLANQTITACFENTSQSQSLDPALLLVEKAVDEAIKQRKREHGNNEQQNKAPHVYTTENFCPLNSANDQPRIKVQRVHSSGTFIPLIQSMPRPEINTNPAVTASVTASRVCNNNTLMQPPPAYDTLTNNLTKQRLSDMKYVESISFMRNDNEHTPLRVPPSLRRAEDNSAHLVSNPITHSPRRVNSDAGEHSFFPAVPFPRQTEDNINQTACGLIAQNSADSLRTQQTDSITEQTRSFVAAPNLRRMENSAAQIRLKSVAQSPNRTETSTREQCCSLTIHNTSESNGQNRNNLVNQSPRRNETNPLNHLNNMIVGSPTVHEINNREVSDITELLFKYLCFFNGMKRAEHAYIAEFSKLKTVRFPIPHVDATIRQFLSENLTKFYILSKELIQDLQKLNLTRVTATFQKIQTIIENICKAMKTLDTSKPLSITSIYLMLEALIEPEAMHYVSVPFLKGLLDVVVLVTKRIRYSSAVQRQAEVGNSIPPQDPFMPHQRIILERQIQCYNEIRADQAKQIAYEQDLQMRIAIAQQLQAPSAVQNHSAAMNSLRDEPHNVFLSWPITNPENGKANHTSSTLQTVELAGNREPTSQSNVEIPPMVNNSVTSQATNSNFTLPNAPKLKSLLVGDANKASTKVTKRNYPSSPCPSGGTFIFQPPKKTRVETTNSNLTVHSDVLINSGPGFATTGKSLSTKRNSKNQKKTQKADFKQSEDAFKIRLPLTAPYDVFPSSTITTTVATPNVYCPASPAARRIVQNSPFRSPLQNYIETFSVPLFGDGVAQITLPNQAGTTTSGARLPVYAPIASITAVVDSLQTREQPVAIAEPENATQTSTQREINATRKPEMIPSISKETTEVSLKERNTLETIQSTPHASEIAPSTSGESTNAADPQPVKDENESQMETIDLTWMDDIDPEQLQHEIEFIAVKKEEPEDAQVQIEENVLNHDQLAVVEYNEQVFTNRSCICGKAAEYICGCMMAMYCSEPCQLKDWKTHKELCLKYNAKNSNKDIAQNHSPKEDVYKNKKK